MGVFSKPAPLVQPSDGLKRPLTPEDRRYLAAEGDPDIWGVDVDYVSLEARSLAVMADPLDASSALQEIARQHAERVRQELDLKQYRMVVDRLMHDPTFMDALADKLMARLTKRHAAAEEEESEADHRAALNDATGVGGQG